MEVSESYTNHYSGTRTFRGFLPGVKALLSLLLILAFTQFSRAQDPGKGGTVAGFESDAHFQSGIIPSFWNAFPANYTPNLTTFGDDWSKGPTGNAVLKQVGGVSVPGVTADRRSIWQVDGNSGSASVDPEGSTFSGSSNKNGDNIAPGQSPYLVELGGSTPQKNDLTNTFLHGRIDPSTTHTWVFFAAETRSTDGSSYLDFEYNQAGVQVVPNGSKFNLIGNGPVGGRTINDLLVIVNFEQGGAKPLVAIRKWQANGTWSDELPLTAQQIFIATNTADVPAVAPNAAFAGNGARSNTTLALQLVEGGIDISSLALGGTFQACNPQSTVTVKTRSSASFTSELKDYDILKFSATPPAEATVAAITPQCRDASGSNIFSLSGTYVGVNPVWSTTSGTLSNQSFVNGVATATLTLPSSPAGASATVTLTAQTGNPDCNQPGTDSKTATVNPLPNVDAGADKVLTCTTTSIALSGSSSTAGATFAWVASNGGHIVSGANTATPTVDAAGTYTLTVTNPATSCTATDVALVTLNNTPPNANAGADKVLTCTITSIQLSGSSTTSGATFSWVASNGGHIVSGANTATPTVDAAGTYTLTVTNPANGCTATDVALVTLNNTPPNANAGADKVLTCTVTSIALSGSSTTAGATFSWVASNGGHIVSGANTATPTVDAAGTYTLTVTNPDNGCTATDVALVTLNNTPPNVNAGADKVLTCTITSIQLSGSSTTSGATFSWVASNGGHIVSGANTATPTVDAAGTYTLTVTNPANGCTATDVALVTLDANVPNANAGADKVLTCTVTSIALSGSSTTSGATFSWVASNGGHIVSGANTATPTVDAAGTYTLTVTNPANGCTATDVALVTLNNTPPNVNAGADKVLTCTTTSVVLDGSSSTAGATFSWVASNGGHIVSGANTATPTVDAAGTYTLTVTNPANGCTATDVALVTLNNTPPNANAGADKVLTCTTTSVVLDGSSTTAGATFAWVASNGGHIVSGANTATPTVDAAGTYTLTVTNPANGCTATDVALVTLNANVPNVDAGADKVLTCTVTSIALSGSSSTAGATFSWVASNGGHIVSGANTATPTVDAAGTYTLTVTNPANGCTATDVALVTLNNTPPNANAGADKVLTCTVTSIALSGSSTTAGATFSWVASNGGHIVSGANTATPTVDAAGTYTLTVTNPANGCTATDVALVTVNNTPPNVNAGADQALSCDTHTAQLSGSSTTAGATFAWVASNGGHIVSGANTATPTVDAAGTYTLTVTNPANGCTATDVALVTSPVCATYCTYTQGFYGNKNGLAMLPSLLTTPITIGRSGHSFIIPANTAAVPSAATLNSMMPGGSTPAVLKAGDCSIMNSCVSQYLTSQGKINNVLLSQTITLTLNTRLKGGILASFPIKSGYIVTQSGCTQLNSSVVNYLTANGTKTATVTDLLNLANDVLGGTKTAGVGGVPSLSNINSVIDAINNVFDGCKSFSGYFPTCPFTTTVTTSVERAEERQVNQKALKVNTYPNPFTDKLRFVIESPVSGQATLELYNMLGQKVQRVFHGFIAAGVSQTVEYNVPAVIQGNLMYNLNMNGERVMGKLLYLKH